MKSSFLVLIVSVFLINCSNSKKTSENNTQLKPVAEVALAPNHIQALLEITDVVEDEKGKIISAKVVEVLNYGSSTDPVPTESILKFSMSNEFFENLQNKAEIGSTINAVLLNEGGGMMMAGQTNSTPWKLISIKN